MSDHEHEHEDKKDAPKPDEVHEEVPDPPKVDDGVPGWGKELQSTVSELAATVAALATPADTPDDSHEESAPEIPKDGEEIPRDESPVKPPWTHRSIPFFSSKG